MSFVDNHDVTRVASILQNPAHLPLIYVLMFTMPGIPCVYYGSEWGVPGRKEDGDDALRPCFDAPQWAELADLIARLSQVKTGEKALCYGDFNKVLLTNEQFVFERQADGERIIVALNDSDGAFDAHFDARAGRAVDLLTGETHDFGGGSALPPYSAAIWKVE